MVGRIIFVVQFLIAAIVLPINIGFAQEVKTTEFASGTVASVKDNQIVVSEYNYEADEEDENTYFVDDKTEINGVHALTEIAANDNIDIVYSIVDGKNVAQSITIEKASSEDDPPAVDQSQNPGLVETVE